jgi:hypothetical protein
MTTNPNNPDAKPDDFEERMNYFVTKLILLWRNDHEEAYRWLMGRDKFLRLFLLTVLLSLSQDPETFPNLQQESKDLIDYFKSKTP